MRLRDLKLEDFAEVYSGGTPSTGNSAFWDGEVPWITPKDLSDHQAKYIVSGARDISEEGLRNSSAKLLPIDTVLLSTRAPIGYVAIAGVPLATNQGFKNLVCKPEVSVPGFLYYLLKKNKELLEAHATGATFKELSGSRLRAIRFQLPDVATQARIADILSAYDDLIENNRRRIELLEESARMLYKEWFVRLRFPGHEHVKIVDGVPERWKKKTLDEVCSSLEDGDWIESKDQGGDDYRLLQISNIGINEFVETGNFRYITDETFRRLRCRAILPGHILIARMPKPIGRAWLVTEMPWKMITSVDVAILEPDPSITDPYFLLHHLNSSGNINLCERRAVGATRPRITRKNIGSLPILLPPKNLQQTFRELSESINIQRTNLFQQNEKLREARDLLLPRLMNGEIPV